MDELRGESELVVLVKAAVQQGRSDDETVYCAGLTLNGAWERLYPLSFRRRSDALQLKRWDIIRYAWSRPADDPRPESRHIQRNSIEIIGELAPADRRSFMQGRDTSSLATAERTGQSLVLMRPRNPRFTITRKTEAEMESERSLFANLAPRLAITSPSSLQKPHAFPFNFGYAFATDEGPREGVYRDWEMNETFSNLRESFGEPKTLARVNKVFGHDYTERGIVFAMSRDTLAPGAAWHIHAVICMDEVDNLIAANLDVMV